MTRLVALLLCAVGCAAPVAEPEAQTMTPTTDVVFSSRFTDEELSALFGGPLMWFAASNGYLRFPLLVSDTPTADAVFVENEDPPDVNGEDLVGLCSWTSGLPRVSIYAPVLTLDQLREVSAHELGHALGLGHSGEAAMHRGVTQRPCLDAPPLAELCTKVGCPNGVTETCE